MRNKDKPLFTPLSSSQRKGAPDPSTPGKFRWRKPQQDKPITRKTDSPLRRMLSIRVYLFSAATVLLFLVALVAVVSYLNLMLINNHLKTNLQEANQAADWSMQIQNEYLLAQQAESEFNQSWRKIGFEVASNQYSPVVKSHIYEANRIAGNLLDLSKSTKNPNILALSQQIEALQPALEQYSSTFDSTIKLTGLRGRSGGMESMLKNNLDTLVQATTKLPDPEPRRLILEIRYAQEAYFSQPDEAYLETIQSDEKALQTIINAASNADFAPSGLKPAEFSTILQSYQDLLSQLITVEQEGQTNSLSISEIDTRINTSTMEITQKSASALAIEQGKIDNNLSTSILVLAITTSAAILVGFGIFSVTSRRIIGPLYNFTEVATMMGKGDLSQRVSVRYGAEFFALANAFNSMADQLKQSLTNLEERVGERTKDAEERTIQLQVASEIARDASSTRDLDVLLSRAVNLARERFKFYHVGIFLLDDQKEYAVLTAATGEAGRAMLEAGHKLKVGAEGMVGFVTDTGRPRISLDVGVDAVHFRNPMLPETRSEMTLPLKVGNQIVGAIDVQSREANAFVEKDTAIFQTMADQLAVAIDNARLVKELEGSVQQLQALYGKYSQGAWERLGEVRQIPGYIYDSDGVRQVQAGLSQAEKDDGKTLSLPLEVRGEVIGTLLITPEGKSFNQEQVSLVEAIRDNISQAMESARLFDDARARVAKEETLNQLTARFTRSIGLETLLQTAVHELGQLPDVTEVSVHIGLPGEGNISMSSSDGKDRHNGGGSNGKKPGNGAQ